MMSDRQYNIAAQRQDHRYHDLRCIPPSILPTPSKDTFSFEFFENQGTSLQRECIDGRTSSGYFSRMKIECDCVYGLQEITDVGKRSTLGGVIPRHLWYGSAMRRILLSPVTLGRHQDVSIRDSRAWRIHDK